MHDRCSLSDDFFLIPLHLRERCVFTFVSFSYGAKLLPSEGQALGLVVVCHSGTFAESFVVGRPGKKVVVQRVVRAVCDEGRPPVSSV